MAAPTASGVPTAAPTSGSRPAHDVCAIVVSHESKGWLEPALSSLFAHAGALDLDVVVVDNGADGAAGYVEERFAGARAMRCANRGFAHANNRAALSADARYVLFLNPDTEVVEGTLADLVAQMDAHPELGLVGCRQLDGEGRLCPTARRFPSVGRALGEALGPERFGFARRLGEAELDLSRYAQALRCDWTAGSFMLVRREALAAAGLLDERFFFYSEEVDLCLRIKRAGWQIENLPQLTIVHHGGSTEASPRMEAQMAYARSQYAAKHFGPLRRRAFVAAIALRHLLRWLAFSRSRPRARRRAQARPDDPARTRAAALRRPRLGDRGARRERALENLGAPQLEHRQRPDPLRVVGAGLVGVEQPLDRLGAEALARKASRVEQDVAASTRAGRRGTTRPSAPRSPAWAGRGSSRAARPAARRAGRLLLHPAQLHRRRERGRELHQLVVEQRRARLQRVGHRGDVHLGQQVAGQVGAESTSSRTSRRSAPEASRQGSAIASAATSGSASAAAELVV